MKSSNWIKTGAIFFFIGCIFILISWLFTYPVYISDINQVTFSQFYPLLWPGIIISLLGIFLITYYCKSKIITALFCSIFPLILEIQAFFFSYIPSSDCGAARGMFQVFQKTGIELKAISYFEFPEYFSLNEILHQIVGLNEKGIALISFLLYGILLGLFLYLVFFNLKKQYNYQILPSILVILYFIGMYSFLNYQWVPQTLALVYFFLLLLISTHLLSDSSKIKWNFILILIFSSLVLTHAIIPVLFISYLGLLTYKKRFLLPIFLAISSIYIANTIYHTTTNMSIYVEAFRQSIQGFGGEYATSISNSFIETGGIIDQVISILNKIRIPIIWIFASVGTFVLFLKRKIDFVLIALGLSGGVYLVIGGFFSILGLRAAQIMFIPLTIGFLFFISKWRKPTIALVVVILILAVSGPMRSAYNHTTFQIDEEGEACDFLANNIKNVTNPRVAINQVNWGYFTNKYTYLKNESTEYMAIRPGSSGFLNIFNGSLNQNYYILYNTNLGKEILIFLLTKEQLKNNLGEIMLNNKIYDGGKTYIIKGI